MPIYEYHCNDCRNLFEERRKMAEADEPASCPTCGSVETRRVISLFNAFSSSGGERRAVVGSSGCAGCTPTPTGCSSCGVKR